MKPLRDWAEKMRREVASTHRTEASRNGVVPRILAGRPHTSQNTHTHTHAHRPITTTRRSLRYHAPLPAGPNRQMRCNGVSPLT